jgi:hypothetical protein
MAAGDTGLRPAYLLEKHAISTVIAPKTTQMGKVDDVG